MFTFVGFTSTGSCKSDITFIDGDQGILLHSYKIEERKHQKKKKKKK